MPDLSIHVVKGIERYNLTVWHDCNLPHTLAHRPSSASISLIKWPLPIPPNEGLHDISPTLRLAAITHSKQITIKADTYLPDIYRSVSLLYNYNHNSGNIF